MKKEPILAAGLLTLGATALAGLAAPWLAPHDPNTRYQDLLNAPPTRVRVVDDSGSLRAPFIYPWTRLSQLEQRYEEERTRPVAIDWFAGGRLARSSDEARAPLLLLGADSYGRDVFARVLYGARTSLALALAAAIGATILGGLLGATAGYAGGALDDALMRGSEFVLVLPTMYVALALRAVMPLVLPAGAVFALLAAIFAVVGAPFISRGVRGIVRSERRLDYASAAAALGAGHLRIVAAAPAAGGARVRRRAVDDAGAGLHRRGGDAVVRRPRLPARRAELGHDAAGSVDDPRDRRFPVAAEPRRGDLRRRARAERDAPEQA